MNTGTTNKKKRHRVRRIILWTLGVILVLIIAGSVFLYYNLNRILTDALNKSFNKNIASDVYELKFEKLSVNFLAGDVKVYNVKLQPREKPLQDYPYINSSFRLTTQKMILKNVEIMTLIKTEKLILDKIEITEPEVELKIEDKLPIFLPFKDTTAVQTKKSNKKSIESFFLKEFDMIDASFHVTNSAKEREFNIRKLSISLSDVMIDQQAGKDLVSYRNFGLSMGEFTGDLQQKSRHISFKDFKINIDSLRVEQTLDTSIYHFADFSTGLKDLDIQTADSLFRLTVQSFDLSYKDRSIKLSDVSFKPNVSEATMQARFKYQNTQFSGTVGTLNLLGVNFDSLIYRKKIFINEVVLDKVSASIFKDKSKPVDPNKFPEYLGQSIKAIPSPVLIKKVSGTNINLVNRERNPDGSYATANINRASVDVKNITNLSSNDVLMLNANAYIENKAHFNLSLGFSYVEPRFSFDGRIEKFNLPGLNPLVEAYTPASIHKGVLDEMTFSGNVYRTGSIGTMKFLYHDLDLEIELEGKAKWKSDVLAFGANTLLPSANPAPGLPPRVVSFKAERDMHKSFVNITIKSLLAGLKETVLMSKENKKAFRQEKKEAKKEARKKAKEEKKKNKQ
ncbi:MAG TPA: hypothetical protein VGQ04_08680 [Chitinophagaceae bacterium]|nr:hypothetical protein [Chitinophagaceae bacterium]